MTSSNDEVAVINKTVSISTKTTFKHILFFYFHSLRTFCHFMPDLSTVVANVVSRFMLEKILVQHFWLLEIFLNKNLWMMVRAFPSFLAVPVHIIPAQFSDNVLVFAWFAQNAKAHVIIWTTFVNVSELAMVSFTALILHEFLAYLDIMTEIALISVRAATQILELITGLDFASVMLVRASLAAFTVYELFAYTIFS